MAIQLLGVFCGSICAPCAHVATPQLSRGLGKTKQMFNFRGVQRFYIGKCILRTNNLHIFACAYHKTTCNNLLQIIVTSDTLYCSSGKASIILYSYGPTNSVVRTITSSLRTQQEERGKAVLAGRLLRGGEETWRRYCCGWVFAIVEV